MKLRRAFMLISVFAMILTVYFILVAMNEVGWSLSTAIADLHDFLTSVFGRVVVTGYFTAGLSLTLFIVYEAQARANNYLYWALLVLIIFGIGAALPFYLYLRMPRRE